MKIGFTYNLYSILSVTTLVISSCNAPNSGHIERKQEFSEESLRHEYRSLEKIVDDLEVLAKSGCAKSQFELSMIYSKNPKLLNSDRFLMWLEKSSRNGNLDAKCELGIYRLENENISSGEDLIRESADSGHPKSQFKMGELCLDPRGAYRWYKKALDSGYEHAAYKIFQISMQDDSIVDVNNALKLLIASVEKHEESKGLIIKIRNFESLSKEHTLNAKCNLIACFIDGVGCRINDAQAREILKEIEPNLNLLTDSQLEDLSISTNADKILKKRGSLNSQIKRFVIEHYESDYNPKVTQSLKKFLRENCPDKYYLKLLSYHLDGGDLSKENEILNDVNDFLKSNEIDIKAFFCALSIIDHYNDQSYRLKLAIKVDDLVKKYGGPYYSFSLILMNECNEENIDKYYLMAYKGAIMGDIYCRRELIKILVGKTKFKNTEAAELFIRIETIESYFRGEENIRSYEAQ